MAGDNGGSDDSSSSVSVGDGNGGSSYGDTAAGNDGGFEWRGGGGVGEAFRGDGGAVLAVMVGAVTVIRKGRDTWHSSYSLPGMAE